MKVQLDAEFPKFINYLKNDFPLVADVGTIVSAYARYTSEENNLFIILLNGYGPRVAITRIEDPIFDTGAVNDEEILFPAWLARDFENGKDLVRVKAGRVHRAGAIMMQLLVVWGYAQVFDQQDRFWDGYRKAAQFLSEVYGHGKIHTIRPEPKTR